MNLEMSATVKRNPEIVFSDMDGETVMMSIENGEYYGIDAIGSHIWLLLEEEMSVEALCDKLCESYDVDENQCRQDVDTFLSQMIDNKVVLIG